MRNLTMLTDLYQLTMMYGYDIAGKSDEVVVLIYFSGEIQEIAPMLLLLDWNSYRIYRKPAFL